MDFRPVDPKHLARARKLAFRGVLNYQPYIFGDDFAVGSGMSIVAGHLRDVPSIYCADADKRDASPEYLAKELAKPDQRAEFFEANQRMRLFYDGMIEQTASALGSVSGMSVLDVGCNTGYFSAAFAKRGASVLGLDRVDYGETMELLNTLCGTDAKFRLWSYDGSIAAEERYDFVLSIAMVVHLSDPLQHLAWLGSSARKALLVFTPCHDDDDYSIRFHTVNRYYQDDRFPYCFDVCTVSKKLLRLSFEQMGFTRMVEIQMPENSLPATWGRVHLGLLGIREKEVAPGTREESVRRGFFTFR